MAKKNAGRTQSPVPSQNQDARSISKDRDEPITTSDIAKVEGQSRLGDSNTAMPPESPHGGVEDGREDMTVATPSLDKESAAIPKLHGMAPEVIMQQDLSSPPSTEVPGSQTLLSRPSEDSQRPSEDSLGRRATGEAIELQEEMNNYLDRIDALRRDMQMLVQTVSNAARKSADAARQAAASAEPGSLEREISQKDEKIALLIEEGTRLSKTEIDLRGTIKKVRAQAVASNKEQETTKSRADRFERSLKAMEDRAKRAEAATKRTEQSLAANSAAAKDLEAVRNERDALNATLAEMKGHLFRANSRAEAAESKAQSEHLEMRERRSAELQDILSSAKAEREISEENLRREVRQLQAALEREKEQARGMETDMLSEQAALESKLESFRVRAEEASSANTGHTHAKLLRQVETLQTQYATASQNWQGIERSLLGQITTLERERDEVVSREAELRKKLRDATLKLKNAERDLDLAQSKCTDMDRSLSDANEETQRLERRATELETDLANALRDLDAQKQNAERELQRRIDEEKSRWTANLHIPRTESPAASLRKNSGLGFDINHLMSPVQYERSNNRRVPIMPNTFDANTPPRQQHTISSRSLTNGSMPETPSVITSMDQDEYFANVPPTPVITSHHSARGAVHDLISASTVGAGPSVQLVERMSANVRRLESEKAASKDELARLTTQRDEARQEVVNLMREVEEKRMINERLNSLEQENASLSQRHQATLELLGERSEQVEELKADILDVKQMYRQLADTMK